MKWIVYYVVTLSLNLFFGIVFRRHLNVTAASAGAVILIVVSLVSAICSREASEKSNTAMYNTYGLNDEERSKLSACFVPAYMICIPLYLPFVLFFGTFAKVVFPIAVFFAGYIGGGIYYRLKYGKDIHARYKKEADELESQKKKEEMGNWK